jgi:uncharacterized protein YacL (UPF0231 family)
MRLLELFRPFRIIASRRVSEEEQVSVEAFSRNVDDAASKLERILTVFRDHRKQSNEEVVRATQQQLAALDTRITAHANELHRLGEELEAKKVEIRRYDDMLTAKKKRVGIHGVE